MIEAAGGRLLDTSFAACGRLLTPGGALLQRAIMLQDQYHATALRAVGFIQRFVFPGRFIPSVTAITQAVCRATDLKVVHLEGVGPHDATPPRDWRRNGHARLPQLRALGDVQSLLSKRRRRRAMIASFTP